MAMEAERTLEPERIQVELLGENFTVRGDSSRDHILKTAAYLNGQFDDLQARYPALSHKNLALLASFHLADELLRVRKDYEALVSILDD